MQLKYLIFIYFISILFPQKYNHQEPIYFSIKENKNYEMMDIIIPSIINNQIEKDVKMFNIKDKSIFYFKLIKDNNDPVIFDFIENSNRIDFTIFIIDLNNNGWIGPYKVDNYSRFLPEFSDRIKSSNILIEVSIPINNKFEFPIENIFTPNEKPKFNKNKKLNKSYFKRFSRDHRRNVLLVGYWPPSNESIREFSKNESLNPNGWVGENWENHGFDVLSYFPTFEDSNCFSCGQGNGSFQVDYQNTTNDWWNVVDSINPIAIITLSRGNIDNTWELEHFYGNWNQWVDDFTPPLQPTPAPPDTLYPSDSLRFSNLPMDSIVSKIQSSGLDLYPYIDYNLGAGNYLSEFLGYHGTLYNDLFNYGINNIDSTCLLAGHIHLGGLIPWETAKEAAKISLREVITSINLTLPLVGDINLDGSFSILDFFLLLSALIGDYNLNDLEKHIADINNDSGVDIFDLILISDSLLQS